MIVNAALVQRMGHLGGDLILEINTQWTLLFSSDVQMFVSM